LSVERWALKNLKDSTAGIRRSGLKKLSDVLFDLFDGANDGVEVRPVAGIKFGMEKFSISTNFERTAARRNQRERLDALAKIKNFGRQTDGLRRVVSDDAVFD
jgi:hypothetical protein